MGWARGQRERGRLVPRFVERELRSFLECGILARGFLRVHCDACGLDRVVSYSCKSRGFCPSCCGRRMADTAAHLVDRVFPEVPSGNGCTRSPLPCAIASPTTLPWSETCCRSSCALCLPRSAAGRAFPPQTAGPAAGRRHLHSTLQRRLGRTSSMSRWN